MYAHLLHCSLFKMAPPLLMVEVCIVSNISYLILCTDKLTKAQQEVDEDRSKINDLEGITLSVSLKCNYVLERKVLK